MGTFILFFVYMILAGAGQKIPCYFWQGGQKLPHHFYSVDKRSHVILTGWTKDPTYNIYQPVIKRLK